jgi:putative ATP-dependent endonuclease of OLD family
VIVRSLRIQRFRGIEDLTWDPTSGVNCLVGPADTGKSTVLAALARLLTPRPPGPPSEYDYYERDLEAGFEISAVIGGLNDEILVQSGGTVIGWLDGKTTSIPDEGGAEPALHCRVQANGDFEVAYELIDGNGNASPFSSGLRRAIRFARIPTEDIAHNELRLGRGSLLERAIGGESLRAPVTNALAQASADLSLPEPVAQAVSDLIASFDEGGLPSELKIGAVTPEGGALLGLLGLLVGEDVLRAIPLARAGSGTRRLALIHLARRALTANPILAIDEPEVGLEPYRQRALVRSLRESVVESGQVFLTTHSATVLDSLEPDEVWRFSEGRLPLGFNTDRDLAALLQHSPDAVLARLPILCEGPTEAGFLYPLLEERAANAGTTLYERGVFLAARGGQPHVLAEAQALLTADLECGLFVDNEDVHAGKRASLKANANCAFGSWEEVRNLEEALARWVPFEHLDGLVETAASNLNKTVDSLRQQVCERAGSPGKKPLVDLASEIGQEAARAGLAAAMQEGNWFKAESRGRAVGTWLLEVGVPEEIDRIVGAFWDQIQQLL